MVWATASSTARAISRLSARAISVELPSAAVMVTALVSWPKPTSGALTSLATIRSSRLRGASGFLLKNAPPEDVIDAVRVVTSGEALLSPSVTRRVIGAFAAQPAPPAVTPAEVELLTDRERGVLAKVAEGLSNAEIAEALYVGEATVKTHVSSILSKLHLRDRVQAVVYAHRHGLIG